MSLFSSEHASKIASAIAFFNSLNQERKAYVVANILNLSKEENNNLGQLLASIQNDISRYDSDRISTKLTELGIENPYATLLVESMKRQAPTIEYQLRELNGIDDESFEDKFTKIMKYAWIDRRSNEEMLKETGLTTEQLFAMVSLIRTYENGLLRSDTTTTKIDQQCRNAGLSAKKTNAIITVVNKELDSWRHRLVFSNTQDSFFVLQELRQQNMILLDGMKEILDQLKKMMPSQKDQSYYQ